MGYYQRLSALDASFLALEEASSHMHVGAVLLFDATSLSDADGALEIDRIRACVDARLDAFPRYRQRLARIPLENHPVWVDDEHFNLLYHVRHTALPRPGSERLLKRLAGRIASQQLDRGKPLWEMWVVEGVEGGRFAVITKVHHCMIDGISGVDLLAALLRPQPGDAVETAAARRARPAPSDRELVVGAAARRLRQPLDLAAALLRGARQPRRSLAALAAELAGLAEIFAAGLAPASATPLNPPLIGPHRRFDWMRMELDALREIRHGLGGTLNDVVLAITAGAVGRFLRARGARGLGSMRFRAMVPVNLRRSGEQGTLGNRVAELLAALPIGERDPRRRLARVIRTTHALKHSRQARGAELIEELGDWTSTALLSRMQRLQNQLRSYNLVVTNVPGPQIPLWLLDAPLLEIYPLVPLFRNQALGIALFSYHGSLFWGLNADWDRVPDLHEFADAIAAELGAMRKAVA